MAMTTGEFSAADADRIAAAYERKFGARPDLLHALTADGAQLM
jgi:hypothetical protein